MTPLKGREKDNSLDILNNDNTQDISINYKDTKNGNKNSKKRFPQHKDFFIDHLE